jgi:chemotaxis protein methyltransferase CheR
MADASFFFEADFELYKKLVYDESGILFTSVNRSILEQRLHDVIRGNGLPNVKAYYTLIKSNRAALKNFLDAITTNLTRFFRNAAA